MGRRANLLSRGGAAIVVYNYTYDAMSMRLTNQITSSNGSNRTELYNYDELNRLKIVSYGDG